MKKVLFWSLLLCISGCAKEEPKDETPVSEQGTAVEISASASVGDFNLGFDRKWSKTDDSMGVFAQGNGKVCGSNLRYVPVSDSAISDFSCDSPVEWEGKAMDMYAYIPYSADAADLRNLPVNVPSEQAVVAGKPDMDAVMMYGSAKVTAKDDAADFMLYPFASLMKLEVRSLAEVEIESLKVEAAENDVLTFSNAAFDLTSGTLSISGGKSSSVTLVFSEPAVIDTEARSFYAWVNPCTPSGGKVKVVAKIGAEEIELGRCNVPEGGFQSGYITELSLTSSYIPEGTESDGPLGQAINLSAFGSANTYIVTKPDKLYCFDADVKGNGVPRSFTWTVDGTQVSQGYSEVSMTPAKAELLWYANPKSENGYVEDSPVLVETVTYNPVDGRIYFRTPATFVNGNAVIAARDADGTILWSWTIWCAEGYDIESTSKKVGRFIVMDRNLGAFAGNDAAGVSDALKAALAIGNYYQWGRKDPFPAPVDYNSFSSMPWGLPAFTPVVSLQQSAYGYDNVIFTDVHTDNAVMLGTALGTSFDVPEGVEESVKYPHKWMYNGDRNASAPYIWAVGDQTSKTVEKQTEWRYLWGSVDGNASVKTIYDPCPAGWKVPTADVWMQVMEGVELSSGKHGAVSSKYDMYIPFAGQKKAYGSSFGTGNAVYMASATVTSPWYPTRGDIVYTDNMLVPTGFDKTNPYANPATYDSYAGQGLQVRCVKEDVASSTQATATAAGKYDAILIGDSITHFWPDRGRAAFFTENNYLCKGVSGQTTMDMVARFTNDVINNRPKVVVITAGTNDLAQNDGFHMSSEDILNNVRLMAQVAEDYGAKVIIGSVPPSTDFYWKTSGDVTLFKGQVVANRIIGHNEKLKAWAQKKGYFYADYHTALKDSENGLKAEYGKDAVHPKYEGYTVMEGVLKPVIDEALK